MKKVLPSCLLIGLALFLAIQVVLRCFLPVELIENPKKPQNTNIVLSYPVHRNICRPGPCCMGRPAHR